MGVNSVNPSTNRRKATVGRACETRLSVEVSELLVKSPPCLPQCPFFCLALPCASYSLKRKKHKVGDGTGDLLVATRVDSREAPSNWYRLGAGRLLVF